MDGRRIAEVRLHGLGSDAGGGGSSARRHQPGLRAPPRPLVRGMDFAPDTQEPHAVEDVDALVIRADHMSVGKLQEEGMMSVAASFPSEKKPRLSNQ